MNFKEILSVTLILFSIIDILGNIPIILSLKEKGVKLGALQTTIASGIIMIVFLYLGEAILSLFHLDVNSFALAGALIIFIIGLEMVLGIELFKEDPEVNSGSIFPVAFPLIAGAGTLTTILSLKAEYEDMNIIAGIVVNLIIIFFVIKSSDVIQRILGKQGSNVLRKVFGIILLAIAIKLFKSNLIGFAG